MDLSAPILNTVKQAWLNDAPETGIATLVPGGIIFETVFTGTAYPYASARITLGETHFTSGKVYSQEYILWIDTWGNNLVGNAGAIQSAIYDLFPADLVLEKVSAAGYTNPLAELPAMTNMICPTPGAFTEDPERQQGKPVIITRNRISITMIQERQ